MLPACHAYGMGVIPWSPLAAGLLAGALGKVEEGTRRAREDLRKGDRREARQARGLGEALRRYR